MSLRQLLLPNEQWCQFLNKKCSKGRKQQSTGGESNKATINWCKEEPETAMALPMVTA